MPDEPKRLTPRPRRPISDPASAAQITDADIDRAAAKWRKYAPPALRDLFDAPTVNDPQKPESER